MTVSLDLRSIARALGGEVQGRQVVAPGPNHSRTDRSMSVRLSHQSPTGFIVTSFAGDPFDLCRDFVSQKLGLEPSRSFELHWLRGAFRVSEGIAPPCGAFASAQAAIYAGWAMVDLPSPASFVLPCDADLPPLAVLVDEPDPTGGTA